MSAHSLYIDVDRREPVLSASSSSIASLPPFVEGDSLQLRIHLLTGFGPLTTYTRVPVSGITLQVAIGTKIGGSSTYYTQQFTWTPSTDLAQPYFDGTLPMNTGAIETLLDGEATADAWIEVKKIESALPTTILLKRITIHAAVIKPDTETVPAPLTPLSAEAANATYVRVEHTGGFNLYNANGKGVAVYVDEDGAFRSDPIEP